MKKIISLAIAAIMGIGLMFGAGCSHRHDFTDWKTLVPATCTREGTESRDCKICEESQTRSTGKAPHSLADVYSADGSKHWKECAVCHQRVDEGAHSFAGSYCSVCKYDKTGTSVLEYTLNKDGKSFTLTGVAGTAPEAVTIPDNYVGFPVTAIAEDAFVEQYVMKSVSLPSALAEIEDGAFRDCTALQSITLPASVKSVGNKAFTGCSALAHFDVAKENKFYAAKDGVLYDAPVTKVILVPQAMKGEYEVPETVKKIGNDLFVGCSLEKITIGEQVAEIELNAFKNCRSLKEFTVKGSGTVIGKAALSGCDSLQKLTLANMWQEGLSAPVSGTSSSGDRATGNSYLGYLFGADLYLETGSKVPASLKTVEFTGGTRLYNGAFQSCTSLEEVILPASADAVEDRVFTGCTSLKRVSVAAENKKYFSQDGVLYSKNSAGAVTGINFIPSALEGDVVIPEGVTDIPTRAFQKRNIASLSLPVSLRYIRAYAFADCSLLTEAEIPEESELISFGENCFSMCVKLQGIVIPAKVTDIGQYAFSGCEALVSAEFKVPSGWKCNATPIEEEILADSFLAANALKNSAASGQQNNANWRREA